MPSSVNNRSYLVRVSWIRSTSASKKIPKKVWCGTLRMDEDPQSKQRGWDARIRFSDPPICGKDVNAHLGPVDHCPLQLLKAGAGFDLVEGRTIVARGTILSSTF